MRLFQISELALEVAILYYGGHLVVTGQMSSGALISFFIYMLELGECLEVLHHFTQPPPSSFWLCVRKRNVNLSPACFTEHCIGVHRPHAGGWSC